MFSIKSLGWTVVTALAFAFSGSAAAQQTYKATGAPNNAPYHSTVNGQNAGLMVDLLNAVAADAGFSVEYLPEMVFAEIIPAINAGTVDIMANNIAITPERQQLVAFSVPFMTGGDALMVQKSDTTDYRTLEDLRGLVVATGRGTLFEAILNRDPTMFAEVKIYDTQPQAVEAVIRGEAKAALISSTSFPYRLAQGEFPEAQLAANWQMVQPSPYGIALRKTDTELLERINTSLTKLMNDGTVGEIFAKYGLPWSPPAM